jgi:hypothetical protein
MKKLLFTALFLTGIAQFASATPIDCGILMAPNSSTTFATTTCTVNPDPGFFISSLTLTATDDYTGFQSGSPDVMYAATLNQTAPVFTSVTYCEVVTISGNSVPCSDTILPAMTVSGLDLSTYSISLINGSNTVVGGTVLGASIGLHLDYAETLSPSSVPEPTTIVLTSGALLGLGLLARRKKINLARS